MRYVICEPNGSKTSKRSEIIILVQRKRWNTYLTRILFTVSKAGADLSRWYRHSFCSISCNTVRLFPNWQEQL